MNIQQGATSLNPSISGIKTSTNKPLATQGKLYSEPKYTGDQKTTKELAEKYKSPYQQKNLPKEQSANYREPTKEDNFYNYLSQTGSMPKIKFITKAETPVEVAKADTGIEIGKSEIPDNVIVGQSEVPIEVGSPFRKTA